METFTYSPLEHHRLIRLAKIVVKSEEDCMGIEQDHLHFELRTCSLDSVKGRYIALSYLWGSSGEQETIKVNGTPFQITINLKNFLKRFVSASKNEILDETADDTAESFIKSHSAYEYWIDAICIDQRNAEEKATQIPMMREIYESSHCVLADLGPGRCPGAGFHNLERVYHAISSATLSLNDLAEEEIFHSDRFWNDAREIFHHPWLDRVWVIQEASTPGKNQHEQFWGDCNTHRSVVGTSESDRCDIRRVYLLLGNSWITWYDLELYYNTLKLVDDGPGMISSHSFESLLEIRWRRQYDLQDSSFFRYLSLFRGLGATEARDVVFAARNLATDLGKDDIVPNYQKPLQELFRDVAVNHIASCETPLDILFCCVTDYESLGVATSTKVSSWIPQWHHKWL
jgi:hypothetical protein